MIEISESISLDEKEILYEFVRASGPGGQNVNKVSSSVQLRFDVKNSPSLPEYVRERLIKIAGSKVTNNGVLVIEAKKFRTQEQNRADAVNRLIDLVKRAVEKQKIRKATKPTAGATKRRLNTKHRRGIIKRLRSMPPDDL